jgi:hypothetical protein
MHRVSSVWPTYIGERRTAFAKAYGINVRWYWEPFGNMSETWELSAVTPPPPPLLSRKFKKQSLPRKSIVRCRTRKWTVNSTRSTADTTGKNPSSTPPPKEKPFTLWRNFPLVAWKLYS